MPYPEGTFDFIYSNQVIEHVEDLNKVLSEMHRVLKNKGNVESIRIIINPIGG
ncbi:MAG: class I SAM-dependent methyltransferase [Candidatus Omnitrophica bacterium]|nr:class I SAM-dependent methyltransferase [Candidatus Omnitrophota bacterium]